MHHMRARLTFSGWIPWRKLMQLRVFRWEKATKHCRYTCVERHFKGWSGLLLAQKRTQLTHDLRRQALATGWFHVHLSRRVLNAWRQRCAHTHEAAVAVAAARTLGCARQFYGYWRARAARRRKRRIAAANRLGARCVHSGVLPLSLKLPTPTLSHTVLLSFSLSPSPLHFPTAARWRDAFANVGAKISCTRVLRPQSGKSPRSCSVLRRAIYRTYALLKSCRGQTDQQAAPPLVVTTPARGECVACTVGTTVQTIRSTYPIRGTAY